MWFGNWYDFYIVQKEVESDTDIEAESAKVNIPINLSINEDEKQPLVHSSPTEPNIGHTGKDNTVVNITNEHENRKLGVIQGV